jgi:hypothetical protein
MLLLWIGLVALLFSSEGGAEEVDPYSLAIVKVELELRKGGRKVIIASHQKQLLRMGDAISIALIKVLDDESLKDPQAIREFLPLIQTAFAEPKLIERETDKKPKITGVLLEYLKGCTSDSTLEREIEQTIAFTRQSVSRR